MDVAVPLGIIINELVSNSLKYAFEGKDQGKIQIKLRREESEEYTVVENISFMGNRKERVKCTNYALSVSDNGIGISEGVNIENTETLGIQLVMILVDQLGGALELKRDNGTKFNIKFIVNETEKQIELSK
jgi:two-component sensor histidine kinase